MTLLLSCLSWLVLVVKRHWRVILFVAAGGVLVIAAVSTFRSCGKRADSKPQISLETVEAINSKDRRERLDALAQTITENADVVKSVDNRSTLADESEAARNAAVWAKINAVDRKIEDAKREGRDVSQAELECMLVPENCSK